MSRREIIGTPPTGAGKIRGDADMPLWIVTVLSIFFLAVRPDRKEDW